MGNLEKTVKQASHHAGCVGWSNNSVTGYATVYHKMACELSLAIRINFRMRVNQNNVQDMIFSAPKCNSPLARPPER